MDKTMIIWAPEEGCGVWVEQVSVQGSTYAVLVHTTIAHTHFPLLSATLLLCVDSSGFPLVFFPPCQSPLSPTLRFQQKQRGMVKIRRARHNTGLVLPLLSLTLNLLFNSSLPNTSDSEHRGRRRTCHKPRNPPSLSCFFPFLMSSFFLLSPTRFCLYLLHLFPPCLSLSPLSSLSRLLPHVSSLLTAAAVP